MYKVIAGFEEVLCSGRFGELVIYKRLCACSQEELKTLFNCKVKGIQYEETIQPKTEKQYAESDEQSELTED